MQYRGYKTHYINEIQISQEGPVTLGFTGGYQNTKNEDGAYVVHEAGAVFTVIMDAHTGHEAIEVYMDLIQAQEGAIRQAMNLDLKSSVSQIEGLMKDMLLGEFNMKKALTLRGETAFLACLQKEGYLWWLSVGDNSLYVFHKDFSDLGQYRVNQRIFYQWTGQANALALDIPAYVQGVLELRPGSNKILLLTDGVLEIPGRPFENNSYLDRLLKEGYQVAFDKILRQVLALEGRDNACLIGWTAQGRDQALVPSR